MFTCFCGIQLDRECLIDGRCPVCKSDMENYIQAHVPCRPETEELEPPDLDEMER